VQSVCGEVAGTQNNKKSSVSFTGSWRAFGAGGGWADSRALCKRFGGDIRLRTCAGSGASACRTWAGTGLFGRDAFRGRFDARPFALGCLQATEVQGTGAPDRIAHLDMRPDRTEGFTLIMGYLTNFYRDSHQKELKKLRRKVKSRKFMPGNRVRSCLWRHRICKFG